MNNWKKQFIKTFGDREGKKWLPVRALKPELDIINFIEKVEADAYDRGEVQRDGALSQFKASFNKLLTDEAYEKAAKVADGYIGTNPQTVHGKGWSMASTKIAKEIRKLKI